jgi:hypothetical protein
VFEVAAICGVPLFDLEQRQLSNQLLLHREKMALIPKTLRSSMGEVKDDF